MMIVQRHTLPAILAVLRADRLFDIAYCSEANFGDYDAAGLFVGGVFFDAVVENVYAWGHVH